MHLPLNLAEPRGRKLTAIALRTARRINPPAGCGPRNNRQEAGTVAGRASLFNYV